MKLANWSKIIITILVVFLAALVGSLATFNAIPTWYASLNPTALTPPNWVFGPVWTLLYILMAIAAALVWQQGWGKEKARQGLILFGFQLILNVMWSLIFFGQHQILLAFIDIVALWIVILLNIIWFAKVSKAAAWLMAPYFLWVSFAAILNLLTYLANR